MSGSPSVPPKVFLRDDLGKHGEQRGAADDQPLRGAGLPVTADEAHSLSREPQRLVADGEDCPDIGRTQGGEQDRMLHHPRELAPGGDDAFEEFRRSDEQPTHMCHEQEALRDLASRMTPQ